jgi:protein involved in polysaccharide export with SLBB domain
VATGEAALLAGPIDPATYRLGPGDVLALELSGRTDRQSSIVVDAEGRIRVPEMGVVAVGGRTLEEVRHQVVSRLRGVYTGVRVELRLIAVRAFKVYVAGQVQAPGVTEATASTRASEVLRGALALLPEASRRNLELRRRDGSHLRVDLDAFSFLGRTEGNPYLEDGDVLVVPTRRERVYAFGAFARPGEYELAPGDRASDLLELAGGLVPGADGSSGRLVRFVSATALDSIPLALPPAGEAGNPELLHQDRLYVRELPEYRRVRNVTVSGEVRYPGVYPVREGDDRLMGLLGRAGGLSEWAAGDRILIFRPTVVAGQRDIEFERLSRLSRSEMTDAEYQTFKTKLAAQQAAYIVDIAQLERGRGEFDVLLKDGDLVVVDRALPVVRVAGEVQRPSLLEFQAGRSGRDYIQLAGGYTQRADGGKVRLTRAGSNQTIYLREAKVIQPGDFIWVPEKKDVNFWGVFKDVLLVSGSVATIVILLRGN